MAAMTWLTSRQGHPYCMVCHKFASPEHLLSLGHGERLGRYNATPWDLEAPDIPWPEEGEPTLPAWGDASLFVYHESKRRWYCRVCKAYVDGTHLASGKHLRRCADGGRWWLERDASAARATGGTSEEEPSGP